jgi:hypothetical protein
MGEAFDLGCPLAALARKYRGLLALRDGTRQFDVRTLRALAREFPGALRELDALPVAELARRLGAVERARLQGAAREPWIEWMIDYHRSMRAALSIRARLGRERAPGAELAQRLAAELDGEGGPEFVLGVANPPAGRLNRLVFARLSSRFGRGESELEGLLFRAEARP